jgi:Ner family transcriptional regulator
MTQQPQGWHREDIKAALVKRCGRMTLLSVTWGYDRSAITNALRGVRRHEALEKRIATALGVSPHALWPDRWAQDGAPLPRSTGAKPSTRDRAAPCQKSRAA